MTNIHKEIRRTAIRSPARRARIRSAPVLAPRAAQRRARRSARRRVRPGMLVGRGRRRRGRRPGRQGRRRDDRPDGRGDVLARELLEPPVRAGQHVRRLRAGLPLRLGDLPAVRGRAVRGSRAAAALAVGVPPRRLGPRLGAREARHEGFVAAPVATRSSAPFPATRIATASNAGRSAARTAARCAAVFMLCAIAPVESLNGAMDKRPLGRTGFDVAPLALGGNVFGWTADETTSFAVLDAFVAGGFQLIDTANSYSRWVPGHQGGESGSRDRPLDREARPPRRRRDRDQGRLGHGARPQVPEARAHRRAGRGVAAAPSGRAHRPLPVALGRSRRRRWTRRSRRTTG